MHFFKLKKRVLKQGFVPESTKLANVLANDYHGANYLPSWFRKRNAGGKLPISCVAQNNNHADKITVCHKNV